MTRLLRARWLAAAALLSLPAVLVLFVLTLLGTLPIGPAVAAIALVAAATIAAARLPLLHLFTIRRTIDVMAGGGRPDDLAPGADPLDFGPGFRRLVSEWRRRDASMVRLARESDSLLNSIPDALLLVDRDLIIRRANRVAERVFGAGIVNREFASVLRPPPLLDAVTAVARGSSSEDVEFELAGRPPSSLRARVETLPHPAEQGWVLVSFHDQTEIKRTERMRADFVANASHELRTPLSALLGFIETLDAGAGDDAATRKRFLGIMGEQAGRMARLVNDLLSLSRIEMREHAQPTDRVDLTQVVRSVADSLQFRARDRQIALQLQMPEDAPPALGDAEELTQVVQNLVDNAIKYGRPGTPVVAALSVHEARASQDHAAPHGTLRVSVTDQGDGIAPELLPRLTERFYRVDAARSRELGGTGLGLAIVKHVVNRHRGTLAIESAVGQGSTFTVSLPVAGPEAPAKPA